MPRRWPVRLAALTAAAGASLAGIAAGASAPPAAGRDVPVIVQGATVAGARAAVEAAGGRATLALPIVTGVAARVPADAVRALSATHGIRAVTPDERLSVASTVDGTSTNGTASVVRQETGADALAGAGDTGAGAVVALIDTGVAPVPDVRDRLVTGLANPVDRSGPPVDCINFSGEPTCDDSYGHGTFMAGLIAGTGVSSDGRFTGEAPGAQILSIKIGGRDGSADVSKLLAALQWVASFRTSYRGPGVAVPPISVVNLSLGTDSTVSYRNDPLNLAVERVWRSGVAVIVSAGNLGPGAGTISKPGDDPLVVTVGAVDDRGTPAVSDDRSPSFSAHGPTAADGLAKPDVVAPGAHLISLRAPGSYVEANAPSQPDLAGTPYRRGSGTSMATAVTSGAAALLWSRWSAQPGFDAATWPDRLKYALTATAHKVDYSDPFAVGAGAVDAAAAAPPRPGLANAGVTTLSDATGTLDGSRGSVLVSEDCTTLLDQLVGRTRRCVVQGQETAQDRAYQSGQYARGAWTADSWYAGQWSGVSWEATQWASGAHADGVSWEGVSWEGVSWESYNDPSADYGTPVAGSAWYGAWG